MRKLASIVRIGETYPIENSDRLSVAVPEGKAWRIVTERGEFKPGDLAIYFEIDSALPPDDERYAFLKERALRNFVDNHGNSVRKVIRIRTIKFRGVISQGLLMPLAKFPEAEGAAVGTDMTDALGVLHFDEVQDEVRRLLDSSTKANTGRPAGLFPYFVPKTDEERCVTSDTMISLADGTDSAIRDIAGSDVDVIAYDTDNESCVRRNIEDRLVASSSVQDQWYRITTESGHSLRITGNSRVWLPELKCYRRVDQLMQGDSLLVKD